MNWFASLMRKLFPLRAMRAVLRPGPPARSLALLACAVLATSGCQDPDAPARSVVRDSAGVEIVENAAPAWSDGEAWRVRPTPRASIGERDGPPERQLFRVAAALLLPDDRMAVLDEGSAELRLFGRDGSHLATTGGEGDGPGEFRGGLSAVVAGDSIVVYDATAGRLSLFDHEGEFIDSRRVRPREELEVPLARYSLVGAVPGRGYLLRKRSSVGNTSLSEPTVWWDSGPNLLASFDGTIEGTWGGSSGMDMWGAPGRSGFPRWGTSTDAAAREGRLYIGHGRRYEVEVYGPDGHLIRLVRRAHERVSGEEADEALREQAVRVAEEEGIPSEALDEFYEQIADRPRAEALPAYSALVVDDRAHLWVERYRPTWGGRTWSDEPPEWDVFDPGGRWLGAVTLPEGVELRGVRDGDVVGVWTDELGTEQVRVYELERGGSGP